PCPPAMKDQADFFAVWGGIAGAQSFLPSLWAAGLEAATVERLTAANVARRFGLAGRKGAISPGMDADLVLLDRQRTQTLRAEDLLMRTRSVRMSAGNFRCRSQRCGCAAWLRGRGPVAADPRAGGS
ncbi:MAG: allantoinase, partial [Chthoniobacterales bacterium]